MIQAQGDFSGQNESRFPDMTALLDVIFILLVFLLLTANVAPRALEVTLPADASAPVMEITERESLTITLFTEGDKWGLEKEVFSHWQAFEFAFAAQLTAIAAEAKHGIPEIVVAGDQQAPLAKVIKLFSWLQKHELEVAQLLVSESE